MIEVIQPKRNTKHEVHPEWEHWMTESTYTHRQAREELGLTNGAFYRRIAKEPTHIDRLAMRALFEGLEPFACES